MERNLAVEIRPKRFSEMIGQDDFISQLKTQFDSGRVPLLLMFVGPPGCGKTTTARIIATSLNCEHAPFGEPCDNCLKTQFDIMEENMGTEGKKEDIRELLECLDYYPTAGKYRVIILDEAQEMHEKAQNALLKPTEDKTGFNVFIICTTNPQKISAALKSRAMIFTVKPLNNDALLNIVMNTVKAAGWSDAEQYAKLGDLCVALAEADVRGGRDVVKATERFMAGASVADSIVTDDAGTIDYNALSRAVLNGQWPTVAKLLSGATVADAATIRTRVTGYLRKVLLSGHSASAKIAIGIIQLANINAYEAGIQLSATCAALYQLTSALCGASQPGTMQSNVKATDSQPTGIKSQPSFLAGAKSKS